MPELRMLQTFMDPVALYREGRARRLPPRDLDLGYLVHAVLAGAYGSDIGSFYCQTTRDRRRVEVLAYTGLGEGEIQDAPALSLTPTALIASGLGQVLSKRMPTLAANTRLQFATRVCPVRRGRHSDGGRRERDAFLAALDAAAAIAAVDDGRAEVTRETAYREWVDERLSDCASLERVRLEAFRLAKFARQTQGDKRSFRTITRPDATIAGELRVTDPEKFAKRLANGVGRHRAFGFGMLRLRPCS